MVIFPSSTLVDSWSRLLQEIELAKNYNRPYLLHGARLVPNPILDHILPSLLYVRMVSILDEALTSHISHRRLNIPSKQSDSLKGKIDFLHSLGELKDASGLHAIRERRNEIAHEISQRATWQELNDALKIIEWELHNFQLIGSSPKYEFYAERSAAKESARPEVFATFDYRYGLMENGRRVIEVSWAENIMRSRRTQP